MEVMAWKIAMPLQECASCLNDASPPAEPLCHICVIFKQWLPRAKYASEMDSLGLGDEPHRYYFVYVLDTDLGLYVGQTEYVAPRVTRHIGGQVSSTRGTNPVFLWHSYPFRSRRSADNAERVLKTLRQMRHEDFAQVTGVQPKPWLGSDINEGRKYAVRTYRHRRRYFPSTPRKRRTNYWKSFTDIWFAVMTLLAILSFLGMIGFGIWNIVQALFL